jgi:hypothetical protein
MRWQKGFLPSGYSKTQKSILMFGIQLCYLSATSELCTLLAETHVSRYVHTIMRQEIISYEMPLQF